MSIHIQTQQLLEKLLETSITIEAQVISQTQRIWKLWKYTSYDNLYHRLVCNTAILKKKIIYCCYRIHNSRAKLTFHLIRKKNLGFLLLIKYLKVNLKDRREKQWRSNDSIQQWISKRVNSYIKTYFSIRFYLVDEMRDPISFLGKTKKKKKN